MSAWIRSSSEEDGSTPGMYWYNNDGGQRALFKPNEVMGEARREYACYLIAGFLGIENVKIELIYLENVFGCLSYDFKTDKRKKFKSANAICFDKTQGIEFSYSSFLNKVNKYTRRQLIDMLFFDLLVNQKDRHQFNFEFEVDDFGSIIRMAPIFDNGQSLCAQEQFSYLPWNFGEHEKHFEVFEQAMVSYKHQLYSLFLKCKTNEFEGLLNSKPITAYKSGIKERIKNLNFLLIKSE